MKGKSFTIILAFAVALILPPAQAQTTDRCCKLAELKITGMSLEIAKAENLPAGPLPTSPLGNMYKGTVPAHCRVDGVIEPRIGVDKVPYGIGFAVALPEKWNGRFLFQGGGGLNGTVQLPLGLQVSGDAPSLDQFDMLSAIVDWVENDKAPDSITARGNAFPGRSRPLCPYPQYAHYKGTGDPEDTQNFECR
jgi:hypothetical protein